MKRDASISDKQYKEEMDFLLGRENTFLKFRAEIVKLQDECLDDMQYKILDIVLEKFDSYFTNPLKP